MALSAVLADDHPVSSAGLSAVLTDSREIEIVAVAANGLEAIAAVKAWQPNLAVVDLDMPGATGLEVIAEARRWSPATRFAVATGSRDEQTLRAALAAGAHGLFLKTSASTELRRGLLVTARGSSFVDPEARRILDDASDEVKPSARELQVLHAIAKGASNPQIAEQLGISAKTVNSHRTNLMRKLDVHSTATLLVTAMKRKLI